MRVIFQPYFGQYHVKLFDSVTSNLITTLNMKPIHAAAHAQPNSLASYHDPSTGVNYLFVSCIDTDNANHVDIYQMSASLSGGSPTPVRQLQFQNGVVGLAIQPGTGDLYIATFADADGSGGVFHASLSGGYASAANFTNYDADQSVAKFSANLAFDAHDNLWMTTFDEGGQYLICYTSVPADKTKFYKLVNGNPIKATGLQGSTPPAGGMLPLSQPEGLAFDAWGNLWLANNSDDFPTNGSGNGTILNLSGGWLQALRTLPDNGSPVTFDSVGSGNGVAIYFLAASKFGGLAFNGPVLYANDQEHGVVWKGMLVSESPFIPLTTFDSSGLVASGISTTYPGNGQMVLVDTAPPQLLIHDWSGDTGDEPSAAPSGVLWESTDISLFVDFPQVSVALLTVAVHNIGTTPTSGNEMLRAYWAVASAGLSWPSPWDGFSAGQVGGQIGAYPLGVIAPGASQSFTIQAMPGLNLANFQPGLHFCLLARIEAIPLYPFGMDHPETTIVGGNVNFGENVANNRGIGWHNVTYPNMNEPGGMVVRPANFAKVAKVAHMEIETLDEAGKVSPVPGRLVVTAEGEVGARLRSMAMANLASLEHGWEIRNLRHGIRGLELAPGEALPLEFSFHPTAGLKDYAIRFIQFEESHGRKHIIGGQTFVFGTVKGFHRPKHPKKPAYVPS